tara:strand:+ start:707 stop:910 length:204 start_codon:yes stop_codon:yes gene_type:complete
MYRKHTPTEIVDKIKYNLIQDIGNLWACESITNKGDAKNKTPKNIEFQIKMNLLVSIVSMEVVNNVK